MKKEDVIEFFNSRAAEWDKLTVRNEKVIDRILDSAKIERGKTVLDVACGTGVLIPDYLARSVKSVTAVDISPEMARIAKAKYGEPRVEIICADVEEYTFGRVFDCVMVHNAFPHFAKPEALIKKLKTLVAEGGTLTVAHSIGRQELEKHHSGAAKNISIELISEDELAELFAPEIEVTEKLSDDNMYIVTGTNKSSV